jgi:hypothetical protein
MSPRSTPSSINHRLLMVRALVESRGTGKFSCTHVLGASVSRRLSIESFEYSEVMDTVTITMQLNTTFIVASLEKGETHYEYAAYAARCANTLSKVLNSSVTHAGDNFVVWQELKLIHHLPTSALIVTHNTDHSPELGGVLAIECDRSLGRHKSDLMAAWKLLIREPGWDYDDWLK